MVSKVKIKVVEVVEFEPLWFEDFKREQALISAALSQCNLVKAHHIGSTSVAGLCAKPIIDILLEVNSLDVLDEQNDVMASLGYVAKGEFGIPNRRYYQKGKVHRTHQVHAFLADSFEAKRHIAFKEYLIAFPEVANEYGLIKRAGAAMCNNDIDVYCRHKDSFIKEHEMNALNWKLTQ